MDDYWPVAIVMVVSAVSNSAVRSAVVTVGPVPLSWSSISTVVPNVGKSTRLSPSVCGAT